MSLEKFLLKQDLCHCNKRLPSYEAETQTDQKLTNCRIDNVDETQHRTSQRIEHEPKMIFRSDFEKFKNLRQVSGIKYFNQINT